MTTATQSSCAAISELLPWYANGTLSPSERARVDTHLPHCPDCRQQLAALQMLAESSAFAGEDQAWQPSSAQFAQIMGAIDALESPQTQTSRVTQTKPKSVNPFAHCLDWFKATPHPVAWLMAAETVAIAVLVLMVAAPPPQQTGPTLFQTFSDDKPAATGLPRLSIVFADDITEREIRALLHAQHGQIVQGPSPLGVYTVHLDATDEGASLAAIDRIRAHPKVKLAEALGGGQ